jgi:hypothetical protein
MTELAIQVFSINVEFCSQNLEYSQKSRSIVLLLGSRAQIVDLRCNPEQVHLRTFDVVYDYQMNAQLFGGNGLFVHTTFQRFRISLLGF